MTDSTKQFANSIQSFLLDYGLSKDVATFCAAMTILETDSYSSPIYKENHNLFGMKYAAIRITNSIGVGRKHACYIYHTDSIIDFLFYLAYYHFTQDILTDLEKFKTRLVAKHYSEVPDYIQRVEAIYNQLIN